MPYKLVLSSPTPSTAPAGGWNVGYKVLGSGGGYNLAGPFMTAPIEITTGDPVGTLYEGYITRDCGTLDSSQFFWQTPCGCTGAGYATSPAGDECEKHNTQPPTTTNLGYCFAAATNVSYSDYGSRIYNAGFTASTLNLLIGDSDPAIFGTMTTGTQWANPTFNTTDGPLNREGIWIDSNCDGSPDGATVTATLAGTYTNAGSVDKTIYVGVAADNSFKFKVNGTLIVDSGTVGDLQFKIYHIMPVVVVPGINYLNVESFNAGGAQSMAMVVYDNTATQIQAAVSDAALNIPFHSGALRGTSYDVSTCPSGWSLDTSAGAGNYICRQTVYKNCNTLV